MNVLGRLIFWDFKRASWQYDVVVALILAFIFLTPRELFNDQPKAASIMMLPSNAGYLLEPALMEGVAEKDQARRATDLVREKFKTHTVVNHVEPVYDDEETLTGYMAITRP